MTGAPESGEVSRRHAARLEPPRAARPRAVLMSVSFIGDGASAGCGFQVSGSGAFRALLRRQRHGRADAGPRNTKLVASREMSPCADHAAFRSRSAMPGRQRFAAATRFRRLRAPTAVNPNPRRSSHVHSACQRPYAQEKEGGVHRRCRRLGGGSAGCLHGPGRRRFRKPGQALRGSMPTSRFRPG